MQYRKFCFNTAIFRKNATSLWPVWLSYTLVCLWILPIRTWLQMGSYVGVGQGAEPLAEKLRNAIDSLTLAISPFPVFFFAAASGIAVFSYLFQPRSANMVHALPVRREELFFTNYISGLLFLLAPQFLAFCITVFVWFGNGATRMEYLLWWLGLATGEALLSYSMAVFAAMLSGQAAIAALCFLWLNYLYKGMVSVADAATGMLVYGVGRDSGGNWGEWLSPIPFLKENVQLVFQEGNRELLVPEFRGLECVPWYAAAALLFVAGALFLYRRRHLETASDIVSFPWLRPMFRWCAGIGAAGFCTYAFWESLSPEKYGNIFSLILVCAGMTGVAGFFLCEMLLRKKFLVFARGRVVEAGSFLAILVLFLVCLETDVMGLEGKMPTAGEVAGIYVDGGYQSYLEEPSEIEECLNAHQSVVQQKEEYEGYFGNYAELETPPYMVWKLTYQLKNGKSLRRSWCLPLDKFHVENKEGAVFKLLELEHDPEKYMEYFFSSGYEGVEITEGGNYIHAGRDGEYSFREFSRDEAEQLFLALKEDILSGAYRIYPYGHRKRELENYADTLTFCYKAPKGSRLFQSGEEEEYSGKYPEYVTVILGRGCKGTIETLRKLGYLEQGETPMSEREYSDILEHKNQQQ
ncbi:MAG: hypothetical protein HFH42_04825 [Lachnospiraceae bacterium]|jgi:ABC-2 type transport system permease protein|nr:hypothetical protein [Lachnospiraceae bacterium]